MVTTVTKTIGSGKDYSTVILWESGTDNDLVTADEIQIGKLSTDVLHNYVVIASATVDSTRYRQLEVDPAVKHDGTYYNGGAGLKATSYNGAIDIKENEFRMFDLRLESSYNFSTAKVLNGGQYRAEIHRCIFNLVDYGKWIIAASYLRNLVMSNCILHSNVGTYAFQFGQYVSNIYNVTIMGAGVSYGLQHDSTFANKGTNCVIGGAITGDLGNTGGNGKMDYSTTADATMDDLSGATNSRSFTDHGQSDADFFTDVIPGSEDANPKAGADFIGRGTDLGTTVEFANIDIKGRDRDAEGDVWDQGAIQTFSAAAAPFIPYYDKRPNVLLRM